MNASRSQSDAEDLEVSWSAAGLQSTGRLKQLDLMSIKNAAVAVTEQMNLSDRVKARKQRETYLPPPSFSLGYHKVPPTFRAGLPISQILTKEITEKSAQWLFS